MATKYCVECSELERRPCMAETAIDSGEYMQTGWYYRCAACGAAFHLSEKEIEFQHCVIRNLGRVKT